jgi:predicted PurR-regulated permease PerM
MCLPPAPHRYDGGANLGKPARSTMNRIDETAVAFLESRALLLLLVTVSLGLGWILLPFFGAILWGGVIALLFAPLNRWLLVRLGHRRTPAAALTLGVAVVIVIVPFTITSTALARQALVVYERVASGEWSPALHLHRLFDALPPSVMALLERLDMATFDTLQRRLVAAAAQGSQFIATRALGIGQDTFEFIIDLFITAYLAFFIIRDGDALKRSLRRAIPLAPEHQAELLGKFAAVIRATVKGDLLVAAIQGALGGLAFWFLGVGGALLWGVLMAFLSLLPAVGAALVWLPVAIYFLMTGAVWQGVALIGYGVLVIGLIDNLLRPVLIGNDAHMPHYAVMITTLGGMAVFGINGFVVGPLIAAMFIAAWHIYAVTRSAAEPPQR